MSNTPETAACINYDQSFWIKADGFRFRSCDIKLVAVYAYKYDFCSKTQILGTNKLELFQIGDSYEY